jgi:hypothetical protein
MGRRSHILMDLSPDALLELIGELDDFDRGGRIRIYRFCTLIAQRIKQ